MAHYAYINNNNIVVTILTGKEPLEIIDGMDTETYYSLNNLYTAKYTSETTRFNHAGIGYTYDTARDAFIEPKPFASWALDEATCRWVAPVPRPATGQWQWDEATLSWVAL